MRLNDLKTGMIVTWRNRVEAVVLKNVACGSSDFIENVMVSRDGRTWTKFINYTDNLENRLMAEYDIVKVELPRYYFGSMDICSERKTIWEEKPVIKMTVSEIEEKLGYKIKIISDIEEDE